MPKMLSSLRILSAMILFLAGLAQGANAHNVPGSAQATVPEMTEIATGITVKSLKDNMRPMRDSGGAVQVSTKGGLSATMGNTVPLSFGLTFRDFDTSEMDGSVGVGTLLLGHSTGQGLVYFGGLIVESGDIRTAADNGRIKDTGAGLALGLDYRVTDQLYLTGIVGAMSLDYDVSRGGGAITGSFGASRQFLDLSADYLTKGLGGDLRLGFGLLYVKQKDDGYVESGGAIVAPYRFDQTSATFDLRNSWGLAGRLRPYLELSAQSRIGGSDSDAVLAALAHLDNEARLGIGFEQTTGMSYLDLGLGANFGDDAFAGPDARLTYSLRF